MRKTFHLQESVLPSLSSICCVHVFSPPGFSISLSSLHLFSLPLDIILALQLDRSIDLDALHTGRLHEDSTVLSEESRALDHMHVNHMAPDVDHLNRLGLTRQARQSHIVDDRGSEALGQSSSDADFLSKASEEVETAHAAVDDIVWVVLFGSQDQTLGARFGEVQVKRLQLVSAAALEHGSDGGKHSEVVVISE